MAIPVLDKLPTGKGHIQSLREDLLNYLQYAATQGDLVRIPIPLSHVYLANHPGIVEEILLKKSRSFHKPETLLVQKSLQSPSISSIELLLRIQFDSSL